MARMDGKVDDRRLQIDNARAMQRRKGKSGGTFKAAEYLFRNHWHIETALFVLLGIKSERRVTKVLRRSGLPGAAHESFPALPYSIAAKEAWSALLNE